MGLSVAISISAVRLMGRPKNISVVTSSVWLTGSPKNILDVVAVNPVSGRSGDSVLDSEVSVKKYKFTKYCFLERM